ncbi:hypothetical protein DFP72DRAFT_630175 [Ephemerocybe angulata]|uniref:Uncharacterized protein n=1 Tax=Ephemerocybe angulata TaxID=980116 RepID=A0A8H6ME52_9AGAR|nr:hypothetical protein DFP72DRAFT_630175 [Tulosesus angulatus]
MSSNYAFLSQPPPSKKRALQPLGAPPQRQLPAPPAPPSRRPSFTAKITAWASHVQPGTPAPVSPHCRPSLTAGISHSRVPSSPLIATTPPTTASTRAFDFTALGYNTIFLHMPKTPETPSPLLRAKAQREQEAHAERRRAKEESKERRGRMIKKIRSLTHLKPRAKSTTTKDTTLASPTYTTATAPMPKPSSKAAKAKATQKKKAVYGALVRPPPTLASDLALMQFADGGRMEDHIKRAMTTETGAVADVYRDAHGGVWRDRDEELEYRALLADADSGCAMDTSSDAQKSALSWVKFTSTSPVSPLAPPPTTKSNKAPKSKTKPATLTLARRDSATSQSTLDSDLDPAYLMQTDDAPFYPDERILNFTPPKPTSPLATTTMIATTPHSPIKPGQTLLSLPARPFRAAKHLRKPEFIADMQAFGLAVSLATSPKSPRFALTHLSTNGPNGGVASRTRTRRRPAPLKISAGMQKMRRVVAVSSPGSGVPPLSSSFRAPVPPLPTPKPASKLIARSRSASHAAMPVTVISPTVPTVVDAAALRLVVKEGKEEFMLDVFEPEPVSKFDDSDDEDEEENVRWEFVRPVGLERVRRASRLDLRGLFGAKA